ncbi:MAG: hybrid sensor histidine kinase/response regulator [Bacteroidia bacterium]|nr:hybrid sensor histidine kinase/response regulator [Bacteroidia bacterium]
MKTENLQKPLVLYLDDERNNLISFKAMFRLDFDIKLASSAEEALKMLSECEPHVIISDYRMPFVSGIEFFEKVKERYPKPLRVLLTAYGDMNALTEAINKGNIYRYIKKPWVEQEIRDVVRDGFEFYFTKNELAIRNKELVEAHKDLDRFVYSVSHDLRSPLMGILAISNLLSKSNNFNEIKEYTELISKNVGRLDEFIHNLLEYYKIKRGELTIKQIDFNELLATLAEMYESDAKSKNIHMTYEVEQDEEFNNDPLVIIVAIQNLISNAIKYQRENNPDKWIRIKAIVEGSLVRIVVEDNGIGIDPEYQPRIFEMFYRATAAAMGSGIGLYNAKHALDKLGAEIKVHSVLHEGTKFEIIIPSK